jgi:hypothetical protein
MTDQEPPKVPGYANDIKPLFTELDQDHMSFMFDLWSFDDVMANADDIYDAVSKKRMPKAPEDKWDQGKIDTFKAWMDGKFQP